MNPNKIECPMCDGLGRKAGRKALGVRALVNCDNCLGTGSIPKWPTPEEWERIYPGSPLQDDDTVMIRSDFGWELADFLDHKLNIDLQVSVLTVVAVPGFGKPTADYRPEGEEG